MAKFNAWVCLAVAHGPKTQLAMVKDSVEMWNLVEGLAITVTIALAVSPPECVAQLEDEDSTYKIWYFWCIFMSIAFHLGGIVYGANFATAANFCTRDADVYHMLAERSHVYVATELSVALLE